MVPLILARFGEFNIKSLRKETYGKNNTASQPKQELYDSITTNFSQYQHLFEHKRDFKKDLNIT